VLDEGAEGVADGVLVGERLRQQVRGRADLEHDLGLALLADVDRDPGTGRAPATSGSRSRLEVGQRSCRIQA
jgi:hypothetical protein